MPEKIKVYSAAKAIIVETGKTKEEVWNELTSVFNMQVEKGQRLTFIINSFPLEEQVKKVSTEDDVAGVGDIFKGGPDYILITKWVQYNSFAYEETSATLNPQHIMKQHGTEMKDKMEFSLDDSHPEAVIVEVVRKHQGNIALWEKQHREKPDPNAAKQLLKSILERFYERKRYLNPGSQQTHSMHVERDDNLRINF